MIPIAFKNEPQPGHKSIDILAADIGGTKTNVALYQSGPNGLTVTREKRYVSADHPSLTDIVRDFCANSLPDRIAAAVAGPVIEGRSKLTNLPWELDSAAM